MIGWVADSFDFCKAFIADPYKLDRILSPAEHIIERSERRSDERAFKREQINARREAAQKAGEAGKEAAGHEKELPEEIPRSWEEDNDPGTGNVSSGRAGTRYELAGTVMLLLAAIMVTGFLSAGAMALIRSLTAPAANTAASDTDGVSGQGADVSVSHGSGAEDTEDAEESGDILIAGNPGKAGSGKQDMNEKYADEEDTQAVLYEENATAARQDAASQHDVIRVDNITSPVYFMDRGKVCELSDIRHGQRFAGRERNLMIDVSSNQGRINWSAVAGASVEYAMIRVGYRGRNSGKVFEDPCYQYNLREALRAGIKVGAYFYSQAITVEEGKEEAEFLLDRIKNYDISLPVAIDYEYESMSVYGELNGRLYEARLSVDSATNIALAFCRSAEARGYKPMVYANKDMLINSLDSYKLSGKYSIWLACYAKYATYGDVYSFWQFTDSGHVDGISGSVCLDYWYMP